MIQLKSGEIEINVSNLFDMFSELKMEIKNTKDMKNNGIKSDAGDNAANNNVQPISFQAGVNPFSNTNFDFSAFITEYSELKLKFESLLKEFNEIKPKQNSNKTESNIKNDYPLSQENEETPIFSNFKKISKENVSTDILVENINTIQENLALLSHHLTIKANKEDLDKLMKHIFNDIEKIQSKSNDHMNKVDTKMKFKQNESSSFDKQEIVANYINFRLK